MLSRFTHSLMAATFGGRIFRIVDDDGDNFDTFP